MKTKKIIILLLSCLFHLPLRAFSETQCVWIHFKDNVSVGEVYATLSRYHLLSDKILSNPFRSKICSKMETNDRDILLKEQNIKQVLSNPDSDKEGVYYSAFGLSKEDRDKWTRIYTIAIPSVVVVFGSAAWDWGRNGVKFGFGNEDWFDKNSYSGGADKVGHMTSLYIEKRLATWLALQAGHDMRTSQNIGLYTAGFIGLALEVGDGFSKYRFSTEDLLMDSLGIAFAWFLDEYPRLDELIGLKWEWWPSKEYRDPKNKEKVDVTSDYSGQKVYLTLKSRGITYLNESPWTRYWSLDLGFFTRGYEPDLTPDDKTDNIRRRYYSVGIGLNLSQLIFDSAPDSTIVRTTSSVAKYWVPPGTSYALEKREL